MGKLKKCVNCNKYHDISLASLSRKDNKTMICSICGMKEALQDIGITIGKK
jgi:transcription elongation factor Elf1